MATTTATVSITSSDLIGGMPLSLNATSTLMKTGVTKGMTFMEMGNHVIATGTEFSLAEALGTADGANFLYICNTSTDDTFYMDWGINETMIGRLGAGDWMFVPWNQGDAAAEIEIEAQGGTNTLEYAIFKSDWTLPTAS
tara:strand:- start:545 stop:964 length:420 start_codon:yes stop_codon:yes gene_type:complete